MAMGCAVIEFDGLLKMVMSAGKVSEIQTGEAGTAMRDHSLRTIRPSHGFAQEQIGDFAERFRFATVQMSHPKTVISGESFRGVLHPVRQFAGTRKGGTRFRCQISLGPDQCIAEARLKMQPTAVQR